MQKSLAISFFLLCCCVFNPNLYAQTQSGKSPSQKAAEKWFWAKDWMSDVKLRPHKSINVEEFAFQYRRNRMYWEKAFGFLKDNDLKTLTPGKYAIDGSNVFATVTEDSTKDIDTALWESHRKYVDLHVVISGEEKIGVCAVSKATVIKNYDARTDVVNYLASGEIYKATPGTFFIFFPGDAHQPRITTGSNNVDKKLVIKIRVAK